MFNLKSCLSNLITVQNFERDSNRDVARHEPFYRALKIEKIEIDDTSIHVKKKKGKSDALNFIIEKSVTRFLFSLAWTNYIGGRTLMTRNTITLRSM